MRRFCGTRGWQAILNFKRMLHMKQELLCCAVLALLGAFACLPALRSARPGAKLTQLYRLPKDSAIPFFDLSGDSLTELPDLSRYRIDSLDLLHNCIDTFILERLPRDIEWLDLSYNRLGGTFYYGCLLEVQGGGLFARQDLKWANLSHNPIERVDYAPGSWLPMAPRRHFFEHLVYTQWGRGWFFLEVPADSVEHFLQGVPCGRALRMGRAREPYFTISISD